MNKKNLFWIILILVLCLVGYRVLNRVRSQKGSAKERTVAVVLQNPAVDTIEDKLILTGDIHGESEVAVKPTNSGRVEEIYVNEGDYVDEGDGLMSYVAGIKSEDEMFEDVVTFSPISGYVGIKNVKIGDQVTSGTTVAFNIYKIDTVKIYADVPEKEYSQVKRGTNAVVMLDAFPDKPISGAVTNIRPVIDPLSRTAQIEIEIPNSSHLIKPGMFAKVELILSKKIGALTLPFDSVLGDGENYVYVDINGKAEKRTVRTGIIQDEKTEIISGLTSSDKVIVTGQRVVKEGSLVEESK